MTRQGAPERRADLETRLHYALDQEDTAAFEAALIDAGDCGPTELAARRPRPRRRAAGYVIACRAAEDGNVAMLRAVYRTTGAVRAGRATPLDAAARNGRIAAVRELLRHHRPTALTLAAAVGKGPRAVKTTDILCEAALEGNEVDIDLPAKTAIPGRRRAMPAPASVDGRLRVDLRRRSRRAGSPARRGRHRGRADSPRAADPEDDRGPGGARRKPRRPRRREAARRDDAAADDRGSEAGAGDEILLNTLLGRMADPVFPRRIPGAAPSATPDAQPTAATVTEWRAFGDAPTRSPL